jgi:hypothetical protein
MSASALSAPESGVRIVDRPLAAAPGPETKKFQVFGGSFPQG